ncbi:GNAT family N-acetyltransferase [uncultured Arthrobacter sp.]|uniref:GNAT family N-acetyltransferase n=1 Tax=uncultured Arthrobacter sp. TaxID=114050 RepID=UPI0026363E27|nr:GNAT family N-acetyltransferase [uncultured Arthrobacter sp.]
MPHVVEIHLIVVDRAVHGSGVGSAMLTAIEADAIGRGVKLPEVKTLGPSHPDEGYARTRHFYEKWGFLPLEETDLRGEANRRSDHGEAEPEESPAEAVVREVLEETGRRTRVVRDLGVERYDAWPSKDEVHERRFFQLESIDELILDRWSAGEDHPSDGGATQRWTCRVESADIAAPTPPGR